MKKLLILLSLFSLMGLYGCESKRGELDRQEQQAGPDVQDLRPAPQTGPENGGGNR